MRYYIEINKRDKFTGFFECDERVYFDGNRPTSAYFAFMDLANKNAVEHMTLRTENNGYHGLIAEYSSDIKRGVKNPFWYTNHDDYKQFSAGMIIEPAREQLEQEKAEFLKRFPTFAGHIA